LGKMDVLRTHCDGTANQQTGDENRLQLLHKKNEGLQGS
jgi:hypothetical protein